MGVYCSQIFVVSFRASYFGDEDKIQINPIGYFLSIPFTIIRLHCLVLSIGPPYKSMGGQKKKLQRGF